MKIDRQKIAQQLHLQGYATVEQLLVVSFGEWPPRGLDIVLENKAPVKIVSLLDQDFSKGLKGLINKYIELKRVFGRGSIMGERKIWLHPNFNKVSGGSLSILNHETAHILQGDHTWRAKDIYSMRQDGNSLLRDSDNFATSMSVNEFFAKPAFVDKKNTNSSAFGKMKSCLSKIFQVSAHRSDFAYYSCPLELQARLHEIVAEGYQSWGRLPTSKDELMAALLNSGLDAPLEIRKKVAESQLAATDGYVFANQIETSVPSSGINFVYRHLTPKGQLEFWENIIPLLYGDLLELYGDREGRARMDMGANRRSESLLNTGFAETAFLKTLPWKKIEDSGNTRGFYYLDGFELSGKYNVEQSDFLERLNKAIDKLGLPVRDKTIDGQSRYAVLDINRFEQALKPVSDTLDDKGYFRLVRKNEHAFL